jgi:threonine/homoserine/homoserine lactone efflux protein
MPVSVEFWLTTFIIVITPGTGVVYTMAAGLARGSRASVVAALGSTVGIVPHVLAAITGLAALLHTSALAFQVLKYLGVAYLLYMAISTFRDTSALTVSEDTGPRSVRKVITSAIVLNLLNPKLTIFFFAFLPQFVTAGEPNAFLRMIAMSGVFMAMTFVVFTAYGLFAAAIRTHVISRPTILAWMRRTFAGAFLALGAKLAFTDK